MAPSKVSLALLLALLLCMGLVVSAHQSDEFMSTLTGRRLQGTQLNCESKCGYRCSKASRQKLCFKDCCICCQKCDGCVPPGTAGNREVCPCYASLKNSKGTGKCP